MWHSEFRHLHLPKKTSSQETRVLGVTFTDGHVESPFKLKENRETLLSLSVETVKDNLLSRNRHSIKSCDERIADACHL